MDWRELIISDADSLFGRPHIVVRRIDVNCILEILASGRPQTQILQDGIVRYSSSSTLVGCRLKHDAGCYRASICANTKRGPMARRQFTNLLHYLPCGDAIVHRYSWRSPWRPCTVMVCCGSQSPMSCT